MDAVCEKFTSEVACHAWIVEMVRFLTSIGRRLFSIGLDLHTAGDAAVSFAAREISDVDESVVESSEEVDNSEVVRVLALLHLRRAKVVHLLFLRLLLLLGSLSKVSAFEHLPFFNWN